MPTSPAEFPDDERPWPDDAFGATGRGRLRRRGSRLARARADIADPGDPFGRATGPVWPDGDRGPAAAVTGDGVPAVRPTEKVAAAAGATQWAPAEDPVPAGHRPRSGAAAWDGRDTAMLCGIAALGAAWAMAALWVGAPLLGRGWSWWGLVPIVGLGATAMAVRGMLTTRRTRPVGPLLGAAAVFAGLLGAFAYGISHSVVVDGRIYLETSEVARSYRLAGEMAEDLERFRRADELLGLDAASVRTRFRELEPARREMESVSDRWNLLAPDQLPDGSFVPLVEEARTAAYSAAQALERKQSLLGVSDDRVAAELEQFRSALVTSAGAMGPQLEQVAADQGFELPGPTARP